MHQKILALAVVNVLVVSAAPVQAANYTLQCDIVETAMSSDRNGKITVNPDNHYRETIEFLGNGLAVIKSDIEYAGASTQRVAISDTTYHFYEINRDPRATKSESTIDRQTGRYSGDFEIVIGSYVDKIMSKGTCQPISVAPKM